MGLGGPRRQRRRGQGPQQRLRRRAAARPLPVPQQLDCRPTRACTARILSYNNSTDYLNGPVVAGVLPQGHPLGSRTARAPCPRPQRRQLRVRRHVVALDLGPDHLVAEPQPESEQAGATPPARPRRQPDPDPDSHAHPHRHGGQAGDAGTAKLTAMAATRSPRRSAPAPRPRRARASEGQDPVHHRRDHRRHVHRRQKVATVVTNSSGVAVAPPCRQARRPVTSPFRRPSSAVRSPASTTRPASRPTPPTPSPAPAPPC